MADYFEIRQTALMDVKHKIGQGMNPADAMESTLERLKVPERDKEIVRGYVMSHIDLSEKSAHKGLSAPAAGEDPLSQPKRKTGRSVGEEQNVMGKAAAQDPFAQKDLGAFSNWTCPKCQAKNDKGEAYCEECGFDRRTAQKSADDEAPFMDKVDGSFIVFYANGTKSKEFESKAEAQAFLDSVKGKSSKSISKSSKADRIMSIDNSILQRHGKRSGVALGEEPLRSEFLQEARGVGKLSAEDSAELEYENFHTALDILMREGLAERPTSKSSVSAEDENVKKGEPEKSEVVKWSWSDGVETCEFCGKDTPKLYSVNGKMMCAECKDGEKE